MKAEAGISYLSLEGVDDELQVLWDDALDALLHHVIPVLVLDALQHMALQLLHYLHLDIIHTELAPLHIHNTWPSNSITISTWTLYTQS
jgi:hypothetical protein